MLTAKWERVKEASLFWSWTAKLIQGSFLLGWLIPPRPQTAEGPQWPAKEDLIVRGSRAAELAEFVASWLHKILFALGDLGLKAARSSFFARCLGWAFRSAEYALVLPLAYLLLDYVLRLYSPLAFLTGIWDEVLFLFLLLVMLGTAAVRKRRLLGTPFFLYFSLYLAVYLFLFLVKGPADSQAVEGLRVYVQYPLWFFLGANLLYSRRQFRRLGDFFLLVALVAALYGIYQYVAGVEIPTSWIDSKVETSLKTRVFSFAGSPNLLGSLMVLALPMALGGCMAARPWRKKTFYLIIFGISALCLVFTFSRGAWLACLLALVLFGLWVDRRIIYGLVLVALLTPMALPSVYDRLAYMATPEFKASSERGGRLGRWDKSLAVWQTSPATGVGLGRFGGAVAARYFPDDSFYTDNFYLKTGVEAGWIGLFALLFLLLMGIRLARSSLDGVGEDPIGLMGLGILAGLVGVLGHNLVENIFESPMLATYFWLFLGLLVGLGRVEEKEVEE